MNRRNPYLVNPLQFQQQADTLGGLSYGSEVKTYTPLPVENIVDTAKIFHDRYEEGYATNRELNRLLKAARAHEIDEPYLKEIINEYQDNLTSLVKDGRFESNVRKVKDLAADFSVDKRLEDIKTEMDRIKAVETAVKAEVKTLNAPPGWAEYEIKKRIDEYKNSGGAKTGTKFNDNPNITYINPQDYIDKFLKDWQPNQELATFTTVDKNGRIINTQVKRLINNEYLIGDKKYIGQDELRKALGNILKSDQRVRNSIEREIDVDYFNKYGKMNYLNSPKAYDEVMLNPNVPDDKKKILEMIKDRANNSLNETERQTFAELLADALIEVNKNAKIDSYISNIIEPQISKYSYEQTTHKPFTDTTAVDNNRAANSRMLQQLEQEWRSGEEQKNRELQLTLALLNFLGSGNKGGSSSKISKDGQELISTPGNNMGINGDEHNIPMTVAYITTDVSNSPKVKKTGDIVGQDNFQVLRIPNELNNKLKKRGIKLYEYLDDKIEQKLKDNITIDKNERDLYNWYIRWKKDNMDEYKKMTNPHRFGLQYTNNDLINKINEYRSKTILREIYGANSYYRYTGETDKIKKVEDFLIGEKKITKDGMTFQPGRLNGEVYFEQKGDGNFVQAKNVLSPDELRKYRLDGISYGSGKIPAGYVLKDGDKIIVVKNRSKDFISYTEPIEIFMNQLAYPGLNVNGKKVELNTPVHFNNATDYKGRVFSLRVVDNLGDKLILADVVNPDGTKEVLSLNTDDPYDFINYARKNQPVPKNKMFIQGLMRDIFNNIDYVGYIPQILVSDYKIPQNDSNSGMSMEDAVNTLQEAQQLARQLLQR